MNGVTLFQFTQRIRVPVGFLMAPILFLSARPTFTSLVAGATLALGGLGIRAWASGHLRKNQELTTSGPYAFTRNPLYFGTLLLGAGVAISGGAMWFVALFIGLYLLIYVPVMLAEAKTMRDLFGAEYGLYSREVPLFLPRVFLSSPSGLSGNSVPYRPFATGQRRFESHLYRRHREYRAAFGLAAVDALLAAKL